MLNKNKTFNYGIALYSLVPIVFAYIFTVLKIPVPANATIYAFIIFFAIIGFSYTVRFKIKSSAYFFFSYFLFLVWLFIGYLYSPSTIARDEKLLIIIYNIISPSLIFIFYYFSNNIKLDYNHLKGVLLKFSYALAYIVFIFFVISSKIDETGRYSLPGSENPIFLSRFLCCLCIIILYVDHRISPPFLKYFTLFLLFYLIFLSASKGPLISLLIVIYILFKKKNRINNFKLFVIFISILFLLVSAYFFSSSNYLFDTNFYSTYARLDIFTQIQNNFKMNYLIGSGLGSFNYLFFNVDTFGYPHNIFVELFIENGLVGLFLFTNLSLYFARYFVINIFSLLILFYFFCSQTSGDVSFNGQLFIYAIFFFLFRFSDGRLEVDVYTVSKK
jgi:hypothetical protein